MASAILHKRPRWWASAVHMQEELAGECMCAGIVHDRELCTDLRGRNGGEDSVCNVPTG